MTGSSAGTESPTDHIDHAMTGTSRGAFRYDVGLVAVGETRMSPTLRRPGVA